MNKSEVVTAWTSIIGLEGFENVKSKIDINGWLKLNNTKYVCEYDISLVGPWMMKGYDPYKTGADSHIQDVYVRPKALIKIEQENIFLIQKIGYVGNCLTWYKNDSRGYTINLNEAKEFTEEEVDKIIQSPNSDKIKHLKYKVIAAAELHLNSKSIGWYDYLDTIKNDH